VAKAPQEVNDLQTAPAQAKQRVEVPLDALHPGLILDSDIWSGTERLLSAGVEVTPVMVNRLRARGIHSVFVQADSELAHDLSAPLVDDPLVHLLEQASTIYTQHGLETAIPLEVLENATNQVEGFFSEIEKGEPLEPESARQMIHTMVDLFTTRSNLAIKLLDLDRVDRYTYRHSLNVGMLFMTIASEWAESQDELEELVFGAVLHDLGKAKVGADIINKPSKLSDEEWSIMRLHPVWSAELLEDAGATQDAISVARSHHERLDGRGYPDGLAGNQLSRWVKLSTVCDVYDALTTKRSYKHKMDFAKAIDIIIQDCGRAFDASVANSFIRRIGRYPVGSFVWLSTGEAAVVVTINESAVSRPVVSCVLNADKTPREAGERLDLREHPEIHITGLVGEIDSANSMN
jgi:HD-GYP domain-containing protein (c-di-GMP phosphodiesterase class II)